MNRKIATACCAAVLGLLGLGIAAIQIGGSKDSAPDLQEMLGVPRQAMQLHLYGANRDPKTGASANGLASGRDILASDGKTKVLSINESVSGAVENIHYRSDETKEWSRDYYPLRQDSSQAVQRSVAWFAKDGKTYIGHEVKREDGSWERHGELLQDGRYQQTYFCPDGKTAQKTQLFDKDKKFVSERAVFCETGKPIRETGEGAANEKLLTFFTPDGKPSIKMSQTSGYSDVDFHGDILGANGEVVAHWKTMYGEWGGSESYQTFVNGRLSMEWSNTTYGLGDNTIAKYDVSNDLKRKLFEATWTPNETYNQAKGVHLIKVIEYAADGKNTLREIKFDKGVATTISMPTSDPAKTLIYYLDASGSKVIKCSFKVLGQKDEIEQPLPSKTDVQISADETKTYTHPDTPKWDDGNTDVGNKLYDFP